MAQIDDVEAIHSYLLSTPSKTPAAETIRTNFLSWYENAGWWDKNMGSDWYDEARTRRNQYNLANAVSPAETAQVQSVLATGLTTEQMKGKPRPKIDVKTGKVGTQIHDMPLSSAGQPVLTRVLKKGMNGDDVKTWQSFLGLTPPTGYFDALTESKTRAFQTKSKMTVDGHVGHDTWAKAFPIIQPQMAPDATPAAMFAPADAAPVFTPAPQPQAPAQQSAPAPHRVRHRTSAPAAQTASAPANSADPAASIAAPKLSTAGMMGNLSNMSMGAKVIGAVAALAVTAGVVMSHQEKHGKAHHR